MGLSDFIPVSGRFGISLDSTHDLKVVDLHGLIRPAAGAEALHVIGRVDLHCPLLHLAIDAHAVVDIVDLHTHKHIVSTWHVWYSVNHPTPGPLFSCAPPHPLSLQSYLHDYFLTRKGVSFQDFSFT